MNFKEIEDYLFGDAPEPSQTAVAPIGGVRKSTGASYSYRGLNAPDVVQKVNELSRPDERTIETNLFEQTGNSLDELERELFGEPAKQEIQPQVFKQPDLNAEPLPEEKPVGIGSKISGALYRGSGTKFIVENAPKIWGAAKGSFKKSIGAMTEEAGRKLQGVPEFREDWVTRGKEIFESGQKPQDANERFLVTYFKKKQLAEQTQEQIDPVAEKLKILGDQIYNDIPEKDRMAVQDAQTWITSKEALKPENIGKTASAVLTVSADQAANTAFSLLGMAGPAGMVAGAMPMIAQEKKGFIEAAKQMGITDEKVFDKFGDIYAVPSGVEEFGMGTLITAPIRAIPKIGKGKVKVPVVSKLIGKAIKNTTLKNAVSAVTGTVGLGLLEGAEELTQQETQNAVMYWALTDAAKDDPENAEFFVKQRDSLEFNPTVKENFDNFILGFVASLPQIIASRVIGGAGSRIRMKMLEKKPAGKVEGAQPIQMEETAIKPAQEPIGAQGTGYVPEGKTIKMKALEPQQKPVEKPVETGIGKTEVEEEQIKFPKTVEYQGEDVEVNDLGHFYPKNKDELAVKATELVKRFGGTPARGGVIDPGYVMPNTGEIIKTPQIAFNTKDGSTRYLGLDAIEGDIDKYIQQGVLNAEDIRRHPGQLRKEGTGLRQGAVEGGGGIQQPAEETPGLTKAQQQAQIPEGPVTKEELIAKISDRKARLQERIKGITEPQHKADVESEALDEHLGGYGVTSFKDANRTMSELDKAGIEYAYERDDGRNLKGINIVKGHTGANEAIKKVWGDVWAAEIKKAGGIPFRGTGDEMKVLWPGKTAEEAGIIRETINEKIDAKVAELGLSDIKHVRKGFVGVPTGALNIEYGISDFKRNEKGLISHGEMDREADLKAEMMKDEKYRVIAEKTGYTLNKEGDYVYTGIPQKAQPTGEPTATEVEGVSPKEAKGKRVTAGTTGTVAPGLVSEIPEAPRKPSIVVSSGGRALGIKFTDEFNNADKDTQFKMITAERQQINRDLANKVKPVNDQERYALKNLYGMLGRYRKKSQIVNPQKAIKQEKLKGEIGVAAEAWTKTGEVEDIGDIKEIDKASKRLIEDKEVTNDDLREYFDIHVEDKVLDEARKKVAEGLPDGDVTETLRKGLYDEMKTGAYQDVEYVKGVIKNKKELTEEEKEIAAEEEGKKAEAEVAGKPPKPVEVPSAEQKKTETLLKKEEPLKAAPASALKTPEVIDEESYLATHGASRQDIGEAALHKNIPEGRVRDRLIEQQAVKDRELISKRVKLRKEYRDKVASGEIRPPTRLERLHATAQGMEENASVQAARRLLEKNGIDWKKPLPAQGKGEQASVPAPKVAQRNIFGGEKSVEQLESEERQRLERGEVKARQEQTKGGEAAMGGLPMFENAGIEGSQQTLFSIPAPKGRKLTPAEYAALEDQWANGADVTPQPETFSVKKVVDQVRTADTKNKMKYAAASARTDKHIQWTPKEKKGSEFLNKREKFYTAWKELAFPTQKLQDIAEAELGIKIEDAKNIDFKCDAVRGSKAAAAEYVRTHLKPIFDSITEKRSEKYAEVVKYLVAKDSLWRYDNKDGYVDAGYSREDAQAMVDFVEQGEHPYSKEIQEMAGKVWEYTQGLRQMKLDHAIIDEDLYESLMDPYYVPLYRDVAKEPSRMPAGNRFTATSKGIMRLKGSESGAAFIDPIQNIIRQTHETIENATRADFFNALVDLADRSEEVGRLIRELPPKWIKVGTIEHRGEIDQILRPQIEALAKELGFDVEYKAKLASHVGGRMHKVLGMFKGDTQLKALVGATEGSVAHELGHGIHHQNEWLNGLVERNDAEMNLVADSRYVGEEVPVSYVTYVRSKPEKVAEFISMYVNDREHLAEIAPMAFREFEEKITGDPKLSKLMKMTPTNVKGIHSIEVENFVRDYSIPKDEDIISGLRGGKMMSYRVPIEVAYAVKNLHPELLPTWARIFLLPQRIFRMGTVGLNMSFFVPNLTRDNIDSAMNTKSIPVYDWLNGLKSFVLKDKWYQSYYASGGGMESTEAGITSNRITAGRIQYGSQAGQFLDPYFWKEHGIFKGLTQAAWYAVQTPFRALMYMGSMSEMSTRLGSFRRAQVGLPAALQWYGGKEKQSAAGAVHTARQGTGDFLRKGKYGGTFNELFPFTNMAFEGVDRFVRTVRDDPKRAMLKAFLYGVAPMVGLFLWNTLDDERKKLYKAISSVDKINNWIIITGKNTWFKIPKSFTMRYVVNPIQMAWEASRGFIARDKADIFAKTASSVMPMDLSNMPPVIRMVVEPITNYDMYWRSAIEKPYVKGIPIPGLRFDKRTIPALKVIGKALNISPVMLQHEIELLGGGLAKDAFWASQMLAGGIDEDRRLRGAPVIKRFMGKLNGWNSDIDEAIRDINKELAGMREISMKMMTKTRTPAERAELVKKNAEYRRRLLVKKAELMKAKNDLKTLYDIAEKK